MFILTNGVLPPGTGDYSPAKRLALIKVELNQVESEIRDLESGLLSLLSGSGVIDSDGDPSNGVQPIPGIPTDLHQIRQQLFVARSREGELRTAEAFWTEEEKGDKDLRQKTQDMSKKQG